MQKTSRTPRLAAALALVLALVLGPAVVVAGPAGATARPAARPAALDPATSAGWATHWLATQVTPGGYIPDHVGDPDPSDTVLSALALAAAGHDQATFTSMMSWLAGHVDAVTGTGADADPGSTGYLILAVVAGHDDPTDFGGVDLVARLQATFGLYEPGLYGSYTSVGDPTYSGVFEQSLAILGLQAAGVAETPAALDWLVAQQCGGTDEFDGAWMSYRAPVTPGVPADGLTPCTAFDSSTFTGIDTNSTSLALEALTAAGVTPAHDALGWLARTQNPDGSFGFYVGNDGDPNSTALVVQAIVAAGESPTTGRWALAGGNPVSALESFQLGCDAASTDQGALTFPGTGGGPNLLATEEGIWGLAQASFPLGAVSFSPSPTPCQAATTTTTAPATSTTSTGGSAAATEASAAVPVDATPALTG